MPDHASPLTRRALLGGLTAGALTLTGCGIRLEDDAPDIPFVPTRTPIPGEAALLAVLTSLRTEATSVPEGASTQRADALRDALVTSAVPHPEIDAAESAAAPVSDAEDVSAYEAALADCPAELLPLVGSLTFARMLRPGPKTLWTDPPASTWQATATATRASDQTRAAVWAMTVVVAKGGQAQHRRARSQLTTLQGLQRRQASAGDDDGASAPLGYELDTPVTTAAQARRLATTTTTRLVEDYLRLLPELGDDRAGARELLDWAVTAQGLARAWGARVPVLPGFADG